MANIGFIPARGGSKSIPLKNIKHLCGKPLIYWSAKALQESNSIDVFYIATDCKEIEDEVNKFNFSKLQLFKRSAINAQDSSSTESVMLEFIQEKQVDQNDTFILVQLTNPFIKSHQIEEGIQLRIQSNFDSILSCTLSKRFYWDEKGNALNYDFKNRPRRQDYKGQFLENGAFYINSVKNIVENNNRLSGEIGIYEMPEYSSFEIDEPDDWTIVENLFERNQEDYLKKITSHKYKLIATDVDGVLTDAGMFYSQSGDELKRFSTYDGKAFELFRDLGYKTAILTAEDTNIVANRAKKMKIDFLFQGVKDKLTIMKRICEEQGISLSEVIYVGDDINDKELLQSVGLAFSPCNAQEEIKVLKNVIQLHTRGGDGVIREIFNYVTKE